MMVNARKKISRFDRIMMAITFAEAGERETAVNFMSQKPERKRQRRRVKVGKQIDRRPVLRA